MNKSVKIFSLIFFIAGVAVLAFVLLKAWGDGYRIFAKTDYPVTGQIGDFIGGVVGTLFALTGTLLIYLTFHEQVRENKRSAFESTFFEMIRIHRENVDQLSYRKFKDGEFEAYKNRQVVRVIVNELIECYREVRKFSNSDDVNHYVQPEYQNSLRRMADNLNPKISLIEMARIDVAYSILFYGLGEDGESVIRKNFEKKYCAKWYFKLLFFIKIKPKRSNVAGWAVWEQLRALDLKELRQLLDEAYEYRKDFSQIASQSPVLVGLKCTVSGYEKYYGGHQFRLGHYFRHLYQSFKYLHNHKDVPGEKKYAYGKMYRAQLSTYEQALLFINSISSLGFRWEFLPERNGQSGGHGLITSYNLIKNLPGMHISGIYYKTYYSDVDYETDEQHNWVE